jgi:phospholipase C
VLATVKKMFGLPNFLTKRDASANTFEGLFAEVQTARTDTPVKLPRAALPAITVAADDPLHPANQPLDQDQHDLLQRVYHLTKDVQPPELNAAILPRTQGEAHDFVKESLRRHIAAAAGKPDL